MALNEEVDGDMLLVKDAVNVIGEQNLLTGIEQRIRNCNCRVAFGFENASEELAEEQYESLFLAEHWVEVPKAAMTDKFGGPPFQPWKRERDRKSTRLNSSHVAISYAVFCLKKKKQKT